MTATAPQITLPKGGGAVAGLGETFQPDPFTGTGRFSVPLELPAGRNGLEPSLALTYSSAHGNGPFGAGWALPVPSISRSTRHGIPRYDGTDTFVWDGGEDLVPVARADGGAQRYRPRVEGAFARIEHVTDGSQDYWEVRTGDGRVHLYGTPTPADAPGGWRDPAALADPHGPHRIGSWLLSRTTDACGNTLSYTYLRDPDGTAEGYDQLYLRTVEWADRGSADNPRHLVRVVLAYAPRPDAISSRRLGFCVTTAWRCTVIETRIAHADPPVAVRRVELAYEQAPGNEVSLLAGVRVVGLDGENRQQLPPLSLDYTTFQTTARRFVDVAAAGDQLPAFSLAAPDVELLDLHGGGLPSIVQLDGIGRVWANLGEAKLDRPVTLRTAVSVGGLAAPGVQLADADGDGRPDVVVSGESSLAGYFPLAAGAHPGGFVHWRQAPTFELDDPDVRLIDLDSNGVSDAVRLGDAPAVAYSDPVEGWTALKRLRDAPPVSFRDPRVKVADMTGDGLTDVVLVHDRRLEYWPYRGHGAWERKPVTMLRAPSLPAGSRFDPQRLVLGDVDGDGLADVVYVDDGAVLVWLNQSGIGFSDPIVIPGTPAKAAGDSVRLIDFLGAGIGGLLWSSDAGAQHGANYRFLDFTGGVKPYLLAGIDNHAGARTCIEYASSTRFMRADRDAGRPWRTTLPFPVQVVAKITVDEAFTGGQLTSEYRYHHGHWDGAEREFRGFARVDRRDTSELAPPVSTPPAVTSPAPRRVRWAATLAAGTADRAANVVRNAAFTDGVSGPVVVTGAGTTGPTAATDWVVHHATTDIAASTTTERLASGGLHVSATAAGCGIVQVLRPAGETASRALLCMSVLVERGSVAIGSGDGHRVTLCAEAATRAQWQALRTINERSPVSEVVVAAASASGADFRVTGVLVEPLATGNLLDNADFHDGAVGTVTTLEGSARGGSSAATRWGTWNNSDALTTTELVATNLPGAKGRMLHVTTTGPGNGVVQTFLSEHTGPRYARASALVKVVRGSVMIGSGDGGSINPDAVVGADDGWQLIEGDNQRMPANEVVIYSAGDGGAEFFVDSVWVSRREVRALEYSPPTETRTWYHIGPVGPAHGDWTELDLSSEHWTGDPAIFAPAEDARMAGDLDRRAKRDAVRALRGRQLRRELYVVEGSKGDDLPVTVTEHQHAVLLVGSTPGVFVPHELAQRSTQWEKGDDPLSRGTFTFDYDQYGRSRRTLHVAVPRGRNPRSDSGAGEPYLATETRQVFATSDTSAAYRLDRVCARLTLEILNDGAPSMPSLRAAVDDADNPMEKRAIEAVYTYYDGEPFVGLPWGQHGLYGLETRTERLVLSRGLLAKAWDREPPYLWPFPQDGEGVLLGEYFHDAELTTMAFVRPDARVAVPAGVSPDPALAAAPLGIRWRGELLPCITERHTFSLQLRGQARLWIDDRLVIDAWDTDSTPRVVSGDSDLVANRAVALRLEFRRPSSAGSLSLWWSTPGQASEEISAARLRSHAGSAPEWDHEYPPEFRARVPALAGYVYRKHEAGGPYGPGFDGYHVVSGCRYDVHDGPGGRGLVTVVRDALGHETALAYDEHALLPATVTSAAGLTTRAEYDYRVLRPNAVTDPNGNRTRLTYTPLGMLASLATLGKPDAREGDSDGQPGLVQTYDLLGADATPPRPMSVHTVRRVEHRWSVVDAENKRRANGGLPLLTEAEADALFPQDEVAVSPEHFVQTRELSDGLGRLLQTRIQAADLRLGGPAAPDDDSGLPEAQVGDVGMAVGRPAAGSVLVTGWTERDNKGRVVHAYEPFFSTGYDLDPRAAAVSRERVTTRYDGLGRVVSVIAPDGSETLTVHGVPGSRASPDLRFPEVFEPSPWETFTYDANDDAGRTHPLLSRGWILHWNTPSSRVVDALGRTIETARRGAAPEVLRTTATLDIRGNAVDIEDARGRTATRTAYDLADRAWMAEVLDAGPVRHVLDALGGTIETRHADGVLILAAHDVEHRQTHLWARDRAGESMTVRERVLFGDAAQDAGLSPDAAARGNLLGRPHLVCDEAGAARTFAHDLDGNITATGRRTLSEEVLFSDLGIETTSTVDWEPPRGRTLLEHMEDQLDATSYDVTTVHDALGRQRLVTSPTASDGKRRQLAFTHEPSGQVTSARVDGMTIVDRIAYDAHGRRILVARGNGVMTRFAYDPRTFHLSRLRSERYRREGTAYIPTGASPLQDIAYGFDLVGNLEFLGERAPGCGVSPTPDALDRAFTYDPHYRLTSATGRESGPTAANPWETAFRSVDLTLATTYTEAFEYDGADGLTVQRHTRDAERWTRRFDAAPGGNRLASVTSGGVPVAYTTDARGNVLSESSSRRFDWDWNNRLRAFRTQAGAGPPSMRAQYRYDPAGRRVHKVVSKGASRYASCVSLHGLFERRRQAWSAPVENSTVLIVTAEGTVARIRIGPALDGDETPDVAYELTDHLGSACITLDGDGHFIRREEYSPFGETTFGGYARKRFRFCGKERDEESGLVCFGARYYAPWTGRWLSPDPDVALPGDLARSRYAYVANRPTVATDADGRALNLAAAAIGAGVGFLVGSAVEAGRQWYTTGSVGDWGRVAAAGAGGAVAGGLAGLTFGGSLLVQAAGAGVGAAAGGVVTRSLTGEQQTVRGVATDFAIGVATFGILKGATAATSAIRTALRGGSSSAIEATGSRLQAVLEQGGPSGGKKAIAAVEVEVSGYKGNSVLRARSGQGTPDISQQRVPHAPVPESPKLTTYAVENAPGQHVHSRALDAEVKTLEEVIRGLPSDAHGAVNVAVSDAMCPSCTNAAFQFAGKFPGVNLGIFAPSRPAPTLAFPATPAAAAVPAAAAAVGSSAQLDRN